MFATFHANVTSQKLCTFVFGFVISGLPLYHLCNCFFFFFNPCLRFPLPCSFASRLVAWTLSRVLGASVAFKVGGWKCLRDIVVKFKKVLFSLL